MIVQYECRSLAAQPLSALGAGANGLRRSAAKWANRYIIGHGSSFKIVTMPITEKILVVDDDRFIRMALGEALRSWGYEVAEAGSIAEAEQQFAANDAKVVLLDIELPDGSGLDLLKDLKEENPETIVIMVTGSVDVPNTVAALRGGAHDFIGKPIKLEELRVTLRNALETQSLRREVKHA